MTDALARVSGETLRLLPERAIFWERADTLLVADPHWGKTATFRAAGIYVPGGTTTADLDRLTAALHRTGARRLVLLGDLFHARSGRVERLMGTLLEWRGRHPAVDMVLLPGNHDRAAGPPPGELGIAVVGGEELVEPPFVLTHHPRPSPAGYTLSGHLHPAVTLRGRGRQRERLPCFWFGPDVGVLPAFGEFTGMADVRPGPADRVYVVAEGAVVEVPPRTS